MKILKNLQKILNEIKKDCLKLKRAKQLTEYGEGQLDLIRIISEKATKKSAVWHNSKKKT